MPSTISLSIALSKAFHLFKKHGLLLSFIAFLEMMIVFFLGIIPFFGIIFQIAFSGPLVLGLTIVSLKMHDEQDVSLENMFDGFKNWISAALSGFIVQLAFGFAVTFTAIAFFIVALGGISLDFGKIGIALILLASFLVFCVITITYSLTGFWPHILADNKGEGVNSIVKSLNIAKKNLVALILVFALKIILLFVGFIFLFIGIFPAIAFGLLLITSCYRQVIPRSPSQSEVPPIPGTPSISNKKIILIIVLLILGGIGFTALTAYSFIKTFKEALKITQSTPDPDELHEAAQKSFNDVIHNLSPDFELQSYDSDTENLTIIFKPTGEIISTDTENLVDVLMKFLDKNKMTPEPSTDKRQNEVFSSTSSDEPMWLPQYPDSETSKRSIHKINGKIEGALTQSTDMNFETVVAFFENIPKNDDFISTLSKSDTEMKLVGASKDSKYSYTITVLNESPKILISTVYSSLP